MSFSKVHRPSGISVIRGTDTSGFSYRGMREGKELKPQSEMNAHTAHPAVGKGQSEEGAEDTLLGSPWCHILAN